MKTLKSASLLLAIFTYFIASSSMVLADTRPYFKVFGSDVFAGGWFNSAATSCTTSDSNYQAPTFNPLANQYKGGILAFATTRHGASSDFGAFAMGLIQGDPVNSYGFYTGQTSGVSGLSFANANTGVSSNYWGGYLAGATPQIHCMPDYFGTKQNKSPTPSPTPGGTSFNVGTLPSGFQYLAPAGQTSDIVAGADATIAAGTNVTVFIDGNAYISHNIRYAGSYTTDNVPKLAVVVKGNILVSPGVTQIDGLYIAQPSASAVGTTGSFWTCHDSTNTTPDGYWVYANCGSKLTMSGAIIAKQINLMRINGDLSAAPDNETTGSPNIAESINYVPAMVIGGPFFTQTSNNLSPKINSLISLPPIF